MRYPGAGQADADSRGEQYNTPSQPALCDLRFCKRQQAQVASFAPPPPPLGPCAKTLEKRLSSRQAHPSLQIALCAPHIAR
jgi:hypothetical protein